MRPRKGYCYIIYNQYDTVYDTVNETGHERTMKIYATDTTWAVAFVAFYINPQISIVHWKVRARAGGWPLEWPPALGQGLNRLSRVQTVEPQISALPLHFATK